MKKKIAIIYGNCVTGISYTILNKVEPVKENYELVYFPIEVLRQKELSDKEKKIIKECDLLIMQRGHLQYPEFKEDLPSTCRVVSYPVLLLTSLWPFYRADPRNAPDPDAGFPFGKYPYGDKKVISLLNKELNSIEIFDEYMALDLSAVVDLDRIHDENLIKGYELEKKCDLKIYDYIKKKFSKERLFFTINHPTPELLLYQTEQILMSMTGESMPEEVRREVTDEAPLSYLQVPIHPQVVGHFELEWIDPDHKYRYNTIGELTFRQYIWNYINFNRMNIITVVTPSFNQGEFIEDTIRSVLTQKGDFFIDFIIMDGGSDDDTMNILKKYESLLKNEYEVSEYEGIKFYSIKKGASDGLIQCNGISFRWESRKDRGQVHALKKGFRMAAGDIYCWLNSDDVYVGSDVLWKVSDYFKKDEDLGMLTGDGPFISREGEHLGLHHVDKINIKELLYLDYHILQPSTFIRKGVYREAQLDESYTCAFDAYFFIQLIIDGIKYLKVDDQLGAFRFYSDNKTLGLNRVRYREQKKITRIFSKNSFYNIISYVYRYFAIVKGKGLFTNGQFSKKIFKNLYRFSYRMITGKPGR